MPNDLSAEFDTYDVPTFCARHRISRAMFYKLVKEGLGPQLMKVGARTLVSREAGTAWRQRMGSTAEEGNE